VRELSTPPGRKPAKPSFVKTTAFETAAPPITLTVDALGAPTLTNVSTPMVNPPSPPTSVNTSQPVDQLDPAILQVIPFIDLQTETGILRFTASLRASMKSAANSLEVDTMLVLSMKVRIEGRAQGAHRGQGPSRDYTQDHQGDHEFD